MRLWLCLAPATHSGYAVAVTETSVERVFTLTIEKWVDGAKSILGSTTVTLAEGSVVGATVNLGTVRAWCDGAVVGEASDSTYTSGYVGMEAEGPDQRWQNFSASSWAGPVWAFNYGGLAFGGVDPGATYQLQELPEGIGTPDYVTGDVQRAIEQGEYAGVDLSPGRNVTVKQIAQAATDAELDEARQAFGDVLSPRGSTEEPLYIQLASGLWCCMARPRKHTPVIDVNTLVGKGTVLATLFHATDPRWYTTPTQSATVGLPEPGGIEPPITPPVTIPGGAGGLIEAVNAGGMYMYPRLTFTGPCLNPKASNLSLPGAPSIQFEVSLNPGDTLTVDMNWQSVILVTAGSTSGSSRRNTEMAGSEWWSFPGKSTNLVEFTSEDSTHVAGTLTVEWASARLAL
jgi:hypothetical protein